MLVTMNTPETTPSPLARRPANHRLPRAEQAAGAQRRRLRWSAAVLLGGLMAGMALAQGAADMAPGWPARTRPTA